VFSLREAITCQKAAATKQELRRRDRQGSIAVAGRRAARHDSGIVFEGVASHMATAETKIRLGLDMNGVLLTPEEFDAVEDYDENYRYELIHGVMDANPLPPEASV